MSASMAAGHILLSTVLACVILGLISKINELRAALTKIEALNGGCAEVAPEIARAALRGDP